MTNFKCANKSGSCSFFDSIYKSILDISFYKKWIASPFKQSMIYFILLVLVLTPLSSIRYIYNFNKNISSFMKAVEEKLPHIIITNGVLNVGIDRPVTLVDSPQLLLVVDTSDHPQEELLDKNNRKVILIEKTKLIEQNLSIPENLGTLPSLRDYVKNRNTFEFSSLGNVVQNINITTSEIRKCVPVVRLMTLSVIPLEFIRLFISMFAHAMFLGLIGLILTVFKGLKIKYSQMLRITLHCITLPAIIGIILTAANVPFLWWFTIYYGIGISYIMIIINQLNIKAIR